MALNLLVIVALIAAVVQVYSSQTAAPGVSVEALSDAEDQGEVESDATPGSGEVEGDFFTLEIKTVPAAAFVADGADTHNLDTFDGCVSSPNGGSFLSAPVDLPDDATITRVTAFFNDPDPDVDDDVDMFLSRTNTSTIGGGNDPTRVVIFSTDSSNGDDSGYQDLTDFTSDVTGGEVIDLVTYTYSMELFTAGSTQFCGAQIFWTPEDTSELTFHEVEPCAVFDTRAGKGGREAPLSGGQTVAFDTIMSNYSSQGGVATSCGIPAPNGGLFSNGEGTVAVMLNLVALNPASTGNLKAWDPDASEPDGGILVYTGGENTNVVLPMAVENQTFGFPGEDGGDVNVKNNGSSNVDVRGVIVGYFTKPLINQE